MSGTPPSYCYQKTPRVGYVERKRNETVDTEHDEVQKRLKQTQANATYIHEMKAGRANPGQVQSEAINVPPSKSMLSFSCVGKPC